MWTRLGCTAARAREGYQDIWFYGMQVTLHDRPDEVAMPACRLGTPLRGDARTE